MMKGANGLWRKSWAVTGLALVLCAGFITGCGKNKLTETAPEPATESVTENGAGIPNPMEEVESPQAFEEIGVHMIAPPEAEELRCFILNGEVAEMQFSAEGAFFQWRASDTAQDFSGIFERFQEEVIAEAYADGSRTAEIEIKTTDSGGRLASWSWGTTGYTLYTPDEMTDEAIKDMALKLVGLSENEK